MILVTGGAGFIGAHACVALIEAGHEVVVLDNLANGHPEALDRVGQITGMQPRLVVGDVRNRLLVEDVLVRYGCEGVMHFAGLKAVGESIEDPISYYDANVAGACSLLGAMRTAGVRRLIFSSSATVYGAPQHLPIGEDHPLAPINPYGATKLMIEQMLRHLCTSDPEWAVMMLRYFNPVGAHPSGLIGEAPLGLPNNLLPFVAQTAIGLHDHVRVWGRDYPTRDGTCVRDYIHVVDLVEGHVRALNRLEPGSCPAINLGRGQGYSVLEIIEAFSDASGLPIRVELCDRRPGDVAESCADPTLAERLLQWRAERNLDAICRDAWAWQRRNPTGYGPAGALPLAS